MVTKSVRSLACAVLALCAAAPPAPAQARVTRMAAQVQPARAAPAPAWTAAEGVGRPFGGTVTLALDGVPLENALREIARQAQLRLTYSREALPSELRVSAHATAIRASDAFAMVLRGTELAAVATSPTRVLIVRRAPAPPPATPATEVAVSSAPSPAPAPATAAFSTRAVEVRAAPGGYAPAEVLAGTIHGTVSETGSGRPLNGAQVSIVGSQRTAVTGASGEYTLAGVPAGRHLLRATTIGHRTAEQTVEVADGAVASASFQLTTAAVQLDRLVVTGTAGATQRRAVGNAVTTIDAAEITDRVVNSTVTELLQAKAPGVTILQSSGSPGTASNIRIRGVGSLAASSEPVIYVDGVRVQSSAGGSFRNNWQTPQPGQLAGGGQTASALDAINPDDIESVEVIKGPAASTLYGADAANGVIQIITKKGRPGSQAVQWNARLQGGRTDWGLDTRASFTTCDAARISQPAEWPGCQGVTPGTVLREDFLAPALRTGELRNVALSVRGGGEGYSFFGALDSDREQGVFANSEEKRSGARANFAFYPNRKLDFSVNLAYSRTRTAFPSTDNGPNVLEAAWTYQPGRKPQAGQTYGYNGGTPDQYDRYDNSLRGDRVTLGTTLSYRPFPWFRNRLTVGGDLNARQANRYVPPGGLFAPTVGQMTQGTPRNNLYTVDYAGTLEGTLPLTSLSSAFSFGLQYNHSEYRNTVAQGTGFPTDLVSNVTSATTRQSWDEFLEVKSLGMFVQEQVGWKDRLFVTGAVRVDNSSIFGDNIDRLFYPKLSASYVLSEEPFLRGAGWLDNLKLRAAWGQAGNAPDPFAKLTTYALVQVVDPVSGEVVSATRLVTLGNPDVKPERGSELELGVDAGFLGNRLGMELTWYNKTTHNALMSVPLSPSEAGIAGGSQFRNLGEINNRGVELALTGSPVQTRLLSWEARLGMSSNHNRLVRFGYGQEPIVFGVTTLNQRHAEGYPLAGYWVHDPVLDPATHDYVASEARYLGPSTPTREASLANTFTLLGNLRLFTLFDYKGGYYLLNMTDWRRCAAGLCAAVNAPGVSPERKAQLMASLAANDALYTQRADHAKFRDVSLTWTLPQRMTRRFGTDRLSFTVAGHNLGYLWKPDYTGLDPEVTFNGINQPGEDGQAFGWTRMDYWTVPMTRRITASVDVSF